MFTLALPPDLLHARMQMALSLGWHIVVACFGVAFPPMALFAEWRAHRAQDQDMNALARTWAKALGVLFAVGAVSGTILSFEMGMLWPGLMARFGQIYGFPFTLEGFAFFIEAIFVGVYLYGWDRLPPRLHLLSGFPMIAAGVAGAFFVVAANGWMNTPTGFEIRDGQVMNVDPWAGLLNPSTAAQSVHMILAAIMVTGFCVASVYAVGMLRAGTSGPSRYHRLGLLVPLTVAAITAPIQIVVGDWIANMVAAHQPAKLAALEALYPSGTHVPLSFGGIYLDGKLVGAIQIPDGLSLLIHHDPGGFVPGLDRVPAQLRPPVNLTHLSYDLMVAIGFALLALAAWLGWAWWRHRDIPRSAWFLRAVALSGAAAVTALEAGWTATEVGRQPWIVYQILLTRDAVSTAPGLRIGFYLVLAVYIVLTVMTVYVLRRLARVPEATIAPQELETTP
ncbi:MAG TPA: cytochrome ubiquinol oxidase subunit I [Pseudonocardiaceae bacterium]|nr:cytochrome ubiquinol oxidase subunit I [Pseudonocardiaceae bacterium]